MAPQREWFEKDYYKVLGVPETATRQGDHDARTGSWPRQYHPDANPGDATAEERFKEISAAYDVRRRRGEAQGVRRGPPARPDGAAGSARRRRRPGGLHVRRRRRRPRRPARRPVRPRPARRRRPAARGAGPQRGADLETELHLSFDDAVARRHHHASTSPATRACYDLPRLAAPRPAPRRSACPPCGGRGVVDDNQGLFSFSSPCPRCGGRGVVIDDPCPTCRGTGVERRPREVKVRIPAGVADGQRIRLKGRGGPGRNGGPAGDLYVDGAACSPHPLFAPQGRRPHAHRAGHLPRGGARRRRHRADARRRPGHACASRPGTRSGRTFRVKGRGVADRQGAPATCSSPSRWPCPPSSSAAERKAVEALRPRPTARRHARTWGS